MLKLSNITKVYESGTQEVRALKGVSIQFRPSEFVAILGQSGCGKTTLLNIIGGLDQYTDGDLIIRNRSTKNYKSKDWDTYRNHSVGFVFQSYNLIPHQTVLQNVELALTLSGVGKAERKRRAIAALEKVGLADQIYKKPNQMSGGQMQRVAIARALVNDPEILLADEPTGALDSETSVQVMDILKEVAKDRLVIMVTHNPELAETYATRIVRLLDGNIIADSNPYSNDEPLPEETVAKKKASMSGLTAFALSLSNLMTKKGRAILTAFAGSIGIIGIALILSISNGVNGYIDDVERDTLSNYPLTIQNATMDINSMLSAMQPSTDESKPVDPNKIYSSNVMTEMMDMMFDSAVTNNLKDFKKFLESDQSNIREYVSEIRYLYSTPLNIYKGDLSNGPYRVNPNSVFDELGLSMGGMMSNSDVWSQMTTNTDLLEQQYDVLTGKMPTAWNEVVLIVDENNRVTDYTLYALGVLDINDIKEILQQKLEGKDPEIDTSVHEYNLDDFMNLTFKVMPSTDYYKEVDGKWINMSNDDTYLVTKLQDAAEIKVVGILRPKEGSAMTTPFGVIGYREDLMLHLIDVVNNSAIVQAQKNNPDVDVFNGKLFVKEGEEKVYTMEEIQGMIAMMPPEQQTQMMTAIAQMKAAGMGDEQIAAMLSKQFNTNVSTSTYEDNMKKLGVSDLDDPTSINIYPKDFESKDAIAEIIAQYNKDKEEDDKIVYTDIVGIMMASITTIINAISSILITFVAISLVVSSIMIGIITNISVLERTKEIGVLRAVGASKRDVRRVFRAETMLEGLAAGIVGIGSTLLLTIPVNIFVQQGLGLDATAYLQPEAAIGLILISVALTFIAGLIPANHAAKLDPVVALRSE